MNTRLKNCCGRIRTVFMKITILNEKSNYIHKKSHMFVKDFLQGREVHLVFALAGSVVERDMNSGNKK